MIKANKLRNKKKAVFFTIDAIIASLILIVGLIMLTSSYTSEQPTISLNYLAQDTINVLGTMQVGEINNSYIDELISNGTIDDMNLTLLEQAGVFWARDELDIAEVFLSNITEGLVPDQYGFGMYMDGDVVYRKSDIPENNVVVARKIVSGIEKDRPVNGYVARAVAHTVNRNMTKIISFSPQGSGWYGGYTKITKKFNFTGDHSINDVQFYFSAHVGGNTNDIQIDFNGNPSCQFDRDDISIIRQESGSGYGLYGYIDVPNSCIVNSINSVELVMRNSDYHAHIHPGSVLKINYIDNDYFVDDIDSTVSKRIYFDDITSYDGGWGNGLFQVVPFFIPSGAHDISVSIQVVAHNIENYGGGDCCEWSGWSCVKRCRDIDYQIFLNSDTAMDVDDSPSSSETYQYSPAGVLPYLVNGTNVIGVYVNSYGDYFWGTDDVEIYSDMENNSDGSSYVEVNYTYTPSISTGVIEIIKDEQFGGSWETPKEASFSFPEEAEGTSDVYLHVVQVLSAMLLAKADTSSPPSNTIFTSPGSRIIPTTVYVPSEYISSDSASINYVEAGDILGEDRYVGPNSSIEYGFYVGSFVGYGDVFETNAEAIEDAQDRLESLVGAYISITDIEFENISITDVPSLWGPAVMEARVWT